jgi:hypothetical protein
MTLSTSDDGSMTGVPRFIDRLADWARNKKNVGYRTPRNEGDGRLMGGERDVAVSVTGGEGERENEREEEKNRKEKTNQSITAVGAVKNG